jgi:hypothetical protein
LRSVAVWFGFLAGGRGTWPGCGSVRRACSRAVCVAVRGRLIATMRGTGCRILLGLNKNVHKAYFSWYVEVYSLEHPFITYK